MTNENWWEFDPPGWADNEDDEIPFAGYQPEFARHARYLCERGATDRELAEFFGVNRTTIQHWRVRHQAFCEAMVVGKEHADERVARSLYNRAVGYSFDSEKVFQYEGAIIRAPIVEHVPPDVGAALKWLNARRRTEWGERVISEHVGANGGPIAVETTDGQLARAMMAFLARNAVKES